MPRKNPRSTHVSSNLHGGLVERANIVQALCEKRKLGKSPKPVSFAHEYNVREALEDSDLPDDVLHQLTDYQNGNQVLAKRVMNRLEASSLNERLKGTGFGWNIKTGY